MIGNKLDVEKPYVFEYDMEKRIRTLTKYDGLISLMFRGLPLSNVHILDSLTSNLKKIRNNLKNSGMTPEQIEIYDKKVYHCFIRSVSIIRDRAINVDNPYMIRDINLLYDISRHCIMWLSENLV